ncbi:acetoin:2,6-dichlorophenolindophenol oxidoreductase subunit alpha [Aureimonas endophytica]|uniref:Acetoin:2,6-dichlorophenolindophenol oxidoreductase subunit alpha n=1 Tax=Aureimonas endophytica TaxID=2027858 RepID=A0A917E8Z8_9HYPH|nr:thiamine pyrophosphate-dependent dehydrogenase E1 component subunit alpha [Aureimonas endophytica]GGE11059.1 acetoin:2,6-dichlorophenolindophenol oxidoreductase subunit alpha [Aureimonas endophytica]
MSAAGAETAGLAAMLRIRAFETALSARPDHGFQLISSGEEAVAVGLAAALRPGDQLLTGGRSIGPALARGVDPNRLMAELLGRDAGLNRGRAGRGHVADPESGFFGAHAVVGGNIGVAAGVALARQLEGAGGIVAVLFGDGACGAGMLHETLNVAALWRLPLVFVCNNNGFSVSTPPEAGIAARRLADLASGFGLPAETLDGLDLPAVTEGLGRAAARARSGGGPAFVECRSIRLRAHSTSARETRTREQLAELRLSDPIPREAARLGLGEADLRALEAEAAAGAEAALAFADASPLPPVGEVLRDVE